MNEYQGAIMVAGFGITILITLFKRSEKSDDSIRMELRDKVDKDECHSFKKRIGAESDKHEENISDIKQLQARMDGKLDLIINKVNQ